MSEFSNLLIEYFRNYNIWALSIVIVLQCIGDRALNKHPKVKGYFEPKILKAENYLNKNGKSTVFFTRFLLSTMGPFVNAAAGITKYKLHTFSLYVALGELFWTCIYLGLGYWFGDSWESIVPIVTQFGQFLTYIAILIIAIFFLIKAIRNKVKYKGTP